MRALASLALLLAATWVVLASYDPALAARVRSASLMATGFLLIAAWLVGRLFEQVRLPRISGYLLVGLLAGPAALGVVGKAQLEHMRFVGDIAVSLIALTAGGELRLSWLRQRLGSLALFLACDLAVIYGLVVGAVLLVGPAVLPFLSGEEGTTRAVVAALIATVMIANSPMVAIAMIAEYRATGPLARTTLALTICKDLALIVLFATLMAVSRGLLRADTDFSPAFALGVAVQLLGSFAAGALIGVGMAWYVSRVGAHLPLFVIGCSLLIAFLGKEKLAFAGQVVHLEPLLMALCAGVVMQNLWPERSGPLFHAVEETSLPVYCLFFALAGAKVDVGAFRALWYLPVGFFLLRAGSVWLGVTVGRKVAGIEGPWADKLFLGLIPQAGVSLVLVAMIGQAFEDLPWAAPLVSVLVGMIVCNEMLGPVGFRWALFRAGEARADDDALSG